MAINKVAYGDQTLLDLTEDTVTADKVLEGETFHDKSGVLRSGNLVIPVQDVEVNGESVVNSENVAEIDIPTTDIQTAVDEFETYNGGLLSECKVALSPNQDLHGYPEPWVGGAGKNKLEFPYTDSSKTVSGITYTVKDNGDIAVSGTATAPSYFTFNNARQLVGNGQYIFSKGTTDTVILGADRCQISDNAYINRYADNTSSPTTSEITINISDADNNYARFWISVKNGETVNTIIHPMIRLATETDPTFAPYSNICPISGHTQVEVGNHQKNLFNPSNVLNAFFFNGYNITDEPQTRTIYAQCKPNTVYTVSKTAGQRFCVGYTKELPANGVVVYDKTSDNTASSITITTGADAKYIVGYVYHAQHDSITADEMLASCQIELGSTATAYEPYNGYQVTVNLGGTYYSGTLDVVTGVFVPDTAEKDLSTLTFRTASQNRWLSNSIISEIKHPSSSELKIKFWSDSYYYTNAVNLYFDQTLIGIAVDNEGNILCRNKDANPPTGYIVYELATPTPIQLSPTMVKALVGENHLSAPLEGQEITESKYRELFTWDEVEDYINAHSGGGGGVDYSTTEVNTGIKWIDGKPIYMRTFTNVGLPQNAYSSTLDLGVEADTIVKIEANDSANAGNATIIFEGVYAKINKTAGSNTILNPTNQLAHLSGATLTVYYTKATD